MPRYEFEITGRIEVAKHISVTAKTEEEAEKKANKIIEEMKQGIDKIEISAPSDWIDSGWEWEADPK